MGVLDELGVLEEDEVFIMCKVEAEDVIDDCVILYESTHFIVNSEIAVAKNPCLHPGDARVVVAVDRKELHHLKECVVFSSKGKRPIFNMCSGSDLDGDCYFCTWDSRLIPEKTVEADDYSSGTELCKEIVSMTDIVNFYIKFMQENQLGLIANAHLAVSDRLENGATEPEAVKLAHLFNMGVDFPKTGSVARLPVDLMPDMYPDFMGMSPTSMYLSKKALGKMYRRCKKLKVPKSPICNCHRCLDALALEISPNTSLLLNEVIKLSRRTITYPPKVELYMNEASVLY